MDNKAAKGTYVLLSLGSNLGEKRKRLDEVLQFFTDAEILSEARISSYYTTEPVGYKDQPEFLNAVVSGYTTMNLHSLIEFCKSAEYLLGRITRGRWHEREIDIDVLLYGDCMSNNAQITVPHPRMHQRRFVLVPAAEIAGSEIHPLLNRTLSQLLDECKDNSAVELFCDTA